MTTLNHKALRIALLTFAGLCFAAGCGGDGLNRAKVTGKVTVDGAPVEIGYITFEALPGTDCPQIGTEVRDGNYTFPKAKGPVPGQYKVTILGQRATGKKIKLPPGATPSGKTETDEYVSVIPKKYDRLRGGTEKLEATIAKGANEINFELDTKEVKIPKKFVLE
ncbi:MAG: hypothetical protein Q4G68_14635 [Planctomycetia bacterium]|nr:hypothetical protein [Planctomycetia bacterium]